MAENLLNIENLRVSIGEKKILNGVDLKINRGECHVIMGPNGSGKSTLANVLMGHPKFTITQGRIFFLTQEIKELEAEKRAALGIFLAFQYPREIQGVQMDRFLFAAYLSLHRSRYPDKPHLSVFEFNEKLKKELELLHIKPELPYRFINEGFSGGEKKKAEMLQLTLLEPILAILDETDSGLDVDSLKIVAKSVERFRNPERGVLIVTHYKRLLEYLLPDFVHVMVNGKIVRSGGSQLADELEREGYRAYTSIQ